MVRTPGASAQVWFSSLSLRLLHLARRHRLPAAGGVIILVAISLALFGPFITPFDAMQQNLAQSLERPSLAHALGTDNFGRDILSRIMVGARPSMFIALASTVFGLVPGVAIGLLVGYYENILSTAVMRFADILLAFPGVLMALALIAVIGPGLASVIIGVAVSFIPGYIRLVNAVVLTVKQNEYVASARCVGADDVRILLRYVLPNSSSSIIVQASLNVATALLVSSALSFLGLGADPSLPEWGAMLNGGRDSLRVAPWVTTFPGLAIMLVALGFNLLGDGLRDVFDPRLR